MFGIYAATACRTVPAGDSGELITVCHTLGVAHPPGYPLFTLLGFLFDRLLPFGEPAFRVNLLSAVAGAASIFLLLSIARRLGCSWGGAALAGALHAFSPVVWLYSTVAEVFSGSTMHGSERPRVNCTDGRSCRCTV